MSALVGWREERVQLPGTRLGLLLGIDEQPRPRRHEELLLRSRGRVLSGPDTGTKEGAALRRQLHLRQPARRLTWISLGHRILGFQQHEVIPVVRGRVTGRVQRRACSTSVILPLIARGDQGIGPALGSADAQITERDSDESSLCPPVRPFLSERARHGGAVAAGRVGRRVARL